MSEHNATIDSLTRGPFLPFSLFRQCCLRLLPLWLLLGSGLAAAGPVPVVRFEVESRAGRAVAEQCRAVWEAEGQALCDRLLPADTAVDTVRCLVLDTASFQAHFGGQLPDWGVGVALGSGRLIALDHSRLPAVGRGAREVFLHEMVHALLFQGTEGHWLPTWLHEGAAMRFAGEWRFTDTVSLVLDGRVPDLSNLQGAFPGLADRADRAYRTSLLAVDRLLRDFGPDVIARLVVAARQEADFSNAFLAVTGETDLAFAADFAQAMSLRYGWLVLMTRWPGLFVLAGLLLLFGGGRKMLLSRRRLARMGEEEAAGELVRVEGPDDPPAANP
jgi:hypothetical protein